MAAGTLLNSPPMADWLLQIAKMGEGRVTRSTALQPLLWVLGSMLAAFVAASMSGKAPMWVLIILGSMSAAALVVALVVYCCFAARNPDLLRSEKYLIRRMEIQQGAIGDSDRGVVELPVVPLPNRPQLPGEAR